MYEVTIYNGSDATVIHKPTVNPEDPHLYTGSLVQGSSGEIDSLSFDILPNNPGYDKLNSRTTMVTVMDTIKNATEFIGRVLTITPQMTEDGLTYKSVVCEDRLGFLCDSVQPYVAETTYYGDSERTGVEEFLDLILANHNAQVEDYKKIYRGTVSVTTSTGNITKGLNYQTSWEAIKEKLLDSVGGEIQLYTGPDGLLYLDYAASLGITCDSPRIELGRNIQSVSREIDPSDIITRLIPLGAESDDEDADPYEKLTIESVNNGKLWIDDEKAQEVYGIVVGTVEWDDVTLPENLLTKGKEWLEEQTLTEKVELSLLDLRMAGIDTDEIQRYNWYPVTHEGVGMDDYYRVAKRTINIVNPPETTYEMGERTESLSSTVSGNSTKAGTAAEEAASLVANNINKVVTSLIASNATIINLTALVAEIEEAYITELDVENLLASYGYLTEADIEDLRADLATIQQAYITRLDVEEMMAGYGYLTEADIEDLRALVATINEAYITYAEVQDLIGGFATIDYLEATYATIEEMEATLARIEDLEAAYADIDILNSDVAAINWLLSGYTSTETQEVINLNAANVVIEDATITDAMIADLSASKLTAGTIYTSRVTIMTDEDDDSLLLSDSLIQLSDENGVRIQIGLDGLGNFNIYIIGEDGSIMYDALGVTADGMNDGIIVDSKVADDANIAGYKLDIESVTSCLNDYGQLVVDCANITIDGTTLDVAYNEIIGELSNSMATITRYFCLGDSDEEPPCQPEEELNSPTVDDFTVDEAIVDAETWEDVWTTERLTAPEGLYLWEADRVDYADGTTVWETPMCLTDGYVRDQTTTLQTEFSVIQGMISSKVWMSDIEEATDGLGSTISTMQTQYSELTQTVESILAEIANINSTFGDDYESLYAQVLSLTATVEGIEADVSDVTEIVNSQFEYYDEKLLEITATTEGFTVDLSNLESKVGEYYDELAGELDSTVIDVTYYYSLSDSAEEPACEPEAELSDPTVDDFIVDEAIVDAETWEDIWQTEQMEAPEGLYLWKVALITYFDGTTKWTAMTCLTDGYVRDQTTTLTEEYATLSVDLTSITALLHSIDTTVNGDDNTIGMVEKVAGLLIDMDSVQTIVSDTVTQVENTKSDLADLSDSLTTSIEEISSKVEQTAESLEITFTNALTTIQETQEDMQTEISLMQTYFSFSSDGLIIGKSGSPLTLQLQNDQISFLNYDEIVAYISGTMLYIYKAYLINSLQIGNFQWIPRESGNLSTVWAG